MRETFSDPVGSIPVTEENGDTRNYIAVDSPEALVALAQYGVIEIHPWAATSNDLGKPDQLTFDLDPGGDVGWGAITAGARRVRDVLDDLGLKSYAKLSGGKGVHVVVPIKPRARWTAAKAFCANVAKLIAGEDPDRYVASASKAKRSGKIFIDYLRNSRGATSIAPFSARARPNAPVAVPVRWDELSRAGSADKYTLSNLSRRLARQKGDVWDGYNTTRQQLTEDRVNDVAN
jgi:bifunctional non-homologous end joining protein LigD